MKESKYDLVSIIGVTLCIAAVVFFGVRNWMTADAAPQKARVQTKSAPAAAVQTPAAQVAPVVSGEAAPDLTKIAAQQPALLEAADEFSALIDVQGRGIQSVKLHQHKVQSKERDGEPAQVVMDAAAYPFMSLNAEGMTLYPAAEGRSTAQSVTSSRMDSAFNFLFEEKWQIGEEAQDAGSHEVIYTLTVTNKSQQVLKVPVLSLQCGVLPNFLSDQQNTSFSSGAAGSVAYGIPGKGEAEIFSFKEITKKMNAKKVEEYRATPASWLAVSSKYFLFAVRELNQDGRSAAFSGIASKGITSPDGKELFRAAAYLPEASLMPGQSTTYTVKGYAGPKSYQRLQEMGEGIGSILGMDLFFFWHFDWMGGICRILLAAMNFFAGWFPPCVAYGLGIILVTLLVKLIFLPLSYKSTRGMQKMREVQPELKALREKYKDDTQRLYYEQQKLFKERGVSQLGGCLPMLVQIPVFFAMFNTFRAAIEIRNAQFLWVADLSMPDAIFGLPIHPLALLTGLTMFLQQKLTPMPDPNQARMMNIMSLVFIFFFYNMPAGLTLYMTVNQLFSIGQMLLFRKLEKKQPAKA
ncbi:MAG: membrane protein insertase YidC [Victivallales bacterium]|nr:membrane protein insertase YidC [Victivallales bacterium]